MTLFRRFLNFIHGRTTKMVDGHEITFAGDFEAKRAARAVARRHHAELRRQSRNQ